MMRFGQLATVNNKLTIKGIGRRIRLLPAYKEDAITKQNVMVGYNQEKSFIKEGQFNDGKLNGFGRNICLDMSLIQIGFWNNYELNGFAKNILNGEI